MKLKLRRVFYGFSIHGKDALTQHIESIRSVFFISCMFLGCFLEQGSKTFMLVVLLRVTFQWPIFFDRFYLADWLQ